jgi:hypothetical protein
MTSKTDTAQSKRFIEAAKAAETDEDPATFERVFAKVVPPKTGKPKPKAPEKLK